MEDKDKIYQTLVKKLDQLSLKQRKLQQEIIELRRELSSVVDPSLRPRKSWLDQIKGWSAPDEAQNQAKAATAKAAPSPSIQATVKGPLPRRVDEETLLEKLKKNLGAKNAEEFIGRAIVSIIGVVVLVLGVGFGVKFAIEHGWINPLTRVILGYLTGSALLGIAIYLKKNYHNFSAALLSGATAIYYIVTYMAYHYYELIPNPPAYALMLVITVFTTTAAIYYNQQIIAVIGFLGAYAIPFLLSTDSGNYAALFTYIALINTGILVVGVLRYWKILFDLSLLLTWFVFGSWYFNADFTEEPALRSTAFLFATLYFVLFYATFLAYKIFRGEGLTRFNAVEVAINSFTFYLIGYHIIDHYEATAHLAGLFTLGNAVVHFAVSLLIYFRKERSEPLFFLISGMVLVFLTLAVPIQLDGYVVSIVWSAEATLLFFIGRFYQVHSYEKLALPVFAVAFFSIFGTWNEMSRAVSGETGFHAVTNPWFFSIAFAAAAFGAITWLRFGLKERFPEAIHYKELSGFSGAIWKLLYYSLPYALLITLYYLFYTQIYFGYEMLQETFQKALGEDYYNSLLRQYTIYAKPTWLMNYTLAFASGLALFVRYRLKNPRLLPLALGLLGLTLLLQLRIGAGALSILEKYIQYNPEMALEGEAGFNPAKILLTHYLSYLFIAGSLVTAMLCRNMPGLLKDTAKIINLAMLGFTLYFTSHELIYLAKLTEISEVTKFAMTILWALFALWPMVWGIVSRLSYLRIASLSLLSVVLLKLFFYDMTEVSTIWRTIILLAVGVLLLVTSFLYNKYKSRIFPEE